MVLLTTARLLMRHLRILDAKALAHVFGDPEVMYHGDGIKSNKWIEVWLQSCITQYAQLGFGPYAVVEKESQDFVGYCGLFHFPDVNGKPEIEIGYRLVRAAWGKGYATESARAVRDYAFATLGLNRLIAIIEPSNIASIRVAEKIGMHHEQDVMFDGYSHPDHVYAITRARVT
jgi:[ribosomal protein S5]-alanine N-acetyltransferase